MKRGKLGETKNDSESDDGNDDSDDDESDNDDINGGGKISKEIKTK